MPKVIIRCLMCNKDFETTESRIKYGKKFCSNKCKFEYIKRYFSGENSPLYKRVFSDKTKLKMSLSHKGKFPSKTSKEKTRLTMKRLIKEGKIKTPLFKKGLIPHNKGTSIIPLTKEELYYLYWNENLSLSKISKRFNVCLEAVRKLMIKYGINRKKQYYFTPDNCFKEKRRVYMLSEKNPAWLGGISFELYGREFDDELKERIRAKYNYRCQQCFRQQDELRDKSNKKLKLCVHHIDYNKKNNLEENLISLCQNCHSQTNFKRENWTNYFKERVIL